MKAARFRIFIPLVIAAAFPISLGCTGGQTGQPTIKGDMRDAYRDARELYGYVWSAKQFYEPRSEKRILALLDRLSTDFHRAEMDAPVEAFEPGFRVTLLAQKTLLADAANRFKEGNKEYAEWKLRGMAANCISCHSRYQAPVSFVGDLPVAEKPTPENTFAQGEFLFATRQFDKASELLYTSAQSFSTVESGWPLQFRALKLWLVIEVRTKNRAQESASLLETHMRTANVPSEYRDTLQNWANDLRNQSESPGAVVDPLKEAERLLKPVIGAALDDEEMHLVTTLRATSILHEYLQGSRPVDDRRKGSLLLGVAYSHLPLPLFMPFAQQYLELTIRDFPHSPEAMKAYELYESAILGDLGVTGEGRPAPDQIKALMELRKLASPEAEPTLLMRK